MRIRKLANGNLLVPRRVTVGGVIGDGMIEITPGNPEYRLFEMRYQDELKRLGPVHEEDASTR